VIVLFLRMNLQLIDHYYIRKGGDSIFIYEWSTNN